MLMYYIMCLMSVLVYVWSQKLSCIMLVVVILKEHWSSLEFDDVPRASRRGGGLALLFRNTIRVQRVEHSLFQSFEYVHWKADCLDFSLSTVAPYRPPYSPKYRITKYQFMKELTSLVDILSRIYEPLVIVGDLNFYFYEEDDYYAKELNLLLQSYDLCQHVSVRTH